MHGQQSTAEHLPGQYYVQLTTVFASFPFLFICVVVVACACAFTGILHTVEDGKQRPEVYFLGFVLLLTLGTLLAPQQPKSHVLVFCMQLCCVVYTWISSSLVLSLLLR